MEDHDCGSDELPLNPKHLQTFLLHLDAYKLMGPNGIHPRVLRELAHTMTRTLSIIFQQSGQSEKVPVDWKLANVVPVFEKDKKKDPSNYRSVSLTSVPDNMKIILGVSEKVLKDNALVTANMS